MSEMSEQQQLEQRRVDFELTNFVGVFKNAFTKDIFVLGKKIRFFLVGKDGRGSKKLSNDKARHQIIYYA